MFGALDVDLDDTPSPADGHGQDEVLQVDPVPDARETSEGAEDESADRVPCLIRQFHAERSPEIGDVHPAIDPPPVGADGLEHRSLVIMFVDDLPDDLLEHVLDGDDPDDLAVLVDDECEMDGCGLQVTQQITGPP